MTTTINVRGKEYRVELGATERPEGEKFDLCRVTVGGQDGGPIEGTLKLTAKALETAKEKAAAGGGSAAEWLARACGKSIAAEVVIRKLKPNFSFLVDHRWF